jgi:hypothetical protein
MAGAITATPVQREGEVLDLTFLGDLRLLNSQLARFGIRNLERVQHYLTILDRVMETTEDERIKVMANSVAVNAMKAALSALKAEVSRSTTINVSGNMNVADLRGMTAEQLKAAKIKMLNEHTDDPV